jgi:xylulose-5-phosphate/fructose-6-phosphate phosphoketolase
MADRRLQARQWTRDHGEDDPAIRDWAWGSS